MHNPHHRVWAHQKDPALPEAPPGALAGGPNSALQDPYIRKLGLGGCPPETCYVDNIESYSTNEVAINWNAALAWTAAFLDDVGHDVGNHVGSPRQATALH
jgi:endoglucanase